MTKPHGFSYTVRNSGEVIITHRRRQAAVLRGDQARWFLDRIASENHQELMARVSGNYKRGNERR